LVDVTPRGYGRFIMNLVINASVRSANKSGAAISVADGLMRADGQTWRKTHWR